MKKYLSNIMIKARSTSVSFKKIFKKYNSSFVFGLIFGLTLGTLFSIIDSLIFLSAQQNMSEVLDNNFHDRNIVGLIENSFSTGVAFLIASFIEKKIYSRNINILKHPVIDFIGILLGGFFVTLIYYFFTLIRKKDKKDKKD